VTGRSATTSSVQADVRSLSCSPVGEQVRDDTAERVEFAAKLVIAR
jgi:hypothetical protein